MAYHEILTFLQDADILAVNLNVIWPLLGGFLSMQEVSTNYCFASFFMRANLVSRPNGNTALVRERMLSVTFGCNGEVTESRKKLLIEFLFIYVLTT